MADRDDDDELQMALRMSLHGSPPEPKRSKPIEVPGESPEARDRRVQRELRAAAAERRISLMRRAPAAAAAPLPPPSPMATESDGGVAAAAAAAVAAVLPRGGVLGSSKMEEGDGRAVAKAEIDVDFGNELSPAVADQLFVMLFGSNISKGILSQWSNQGIRFSADPDTSIGLVQHEGGPCGVLATIQAVVLKYLLFFPHEVIKRATYALPQSLGQRSFCQYPNNMPGNFTDISEDVKRRALVLSMVEILFSCGNKKSAAIATLHVSRDYPRDGCDYDKKDEILSKALEYLTVESAVDLQRILRVKTYTSQSAAFHQLMLELPIFQNRMGAMLFLISALLSRGLDSIQEDRDDPNLPLVTAPFGHASQEIVNLLLCGEAAPNVFDGRMDLGGGMFLKGIPGIVEVGFLTLLESLNFCKVGQYLKCPKWPIWVVGSESHYTVLFALDTAVQDENELEQRESKIRKAFNDQDQSGGGGFITVDAFHQVLRETSIHLPPEKIDSLCNTGYVIWNDFWQILLDLDRSMGGLKDSAGSGKLQFEIYHFNGIAKSVSNGTQAAGGEIPPQRPRLCKLRVSVPPRWTQEEFMADTATSSSNEPGGGNCESVNSNELPEPPQHAPLVDCIRTRWPRAVCNWVGDPPSIV